MRIFLFFIFGYLPFAAMSADLTLQLSGFPSQQGKASIAVFDQAENFPHQPEKAIAARILPVEAKVLSTTFHDLAAGKLAVAVYHDENNNGQLDKNFFGIPTEAYGFSNNARGTFGPPCFDEAAIILKNEVTIEITVK